MNIDSIKNGVVIDHIKGGQSMEIYYFLGLDQLECPVAVIKNANSCRMGKKDIIKVDTKIPLNLEVLGYIDPNVTVNIIKDGVRVDKYHPTIPEQIVNIVKCKNPRCITSTESDIPNVFRLTNKEQHTYRCIYCEFKAR